MLSLKRQVAEGVFYFSSGSVTVTLLHFLSSVLLIRSLGLFEYGLFVLALSFYTILASFLDLGIGGVVLSDASGAMSEGNYTKAKNLLKSYILFELFIGITLFFLTAGTSFLIKGLYGEVVQRLLLITAFYLFTTALQNAVSNIFYSMSKFRIYNILLATEALARFSLILVFISILEKGIIFAMLVYLIAQMLGILITLPNLFNIRKQFETYPHSKEPFFRNMLKTHGKWVLFSLPLKRIGSQAHYWITEYFLGVNAVAFLGVAIRGTDVLKVFPQSFERVLMPIASGVIKSWKRTEFLINKTIKYNFWNSILVATIAIIFSPLLIKIVFSGKYIDVVPAFRILLLILIPISLLVLKPIFYALKIQKYLFYSDSISVILIIIFDTVFIWLFGLIGVCISMVLISFILFSMRYTFIKKFKPDFEIRIRNIFEIDDFDKKQLRIVLNKLKEKIHI